MTKDIKTHNNRGEKLLDKISYGKQFQAGILAIRKDPLINIPENGYSTTEEIHKWYNDRDPLSFVTGIKAPARKKLRELIDLFLQKHSLPLNAWWRRNIHEYIFSNNGKIKFLPVQHRAEPFVEVVGIEQDLRKGGFTDIRIYDGVSHRDIRDFLARNSFEPAHRVDTHLHIKKDKDVEINAFIMGLAKYKKAELELEKDPYASTTKEILISRKVFEKFGKDLSPAAIKSIIQRKRKSKR